MMNMSGDGGFYEDDEPVEDVVAAFNAGPHGVTGPPRGQTQTFALTTNTVSGFLTTPEENQPTGQPIHC